MEVVCECAAYAKARTCTVILSSESNVNWDETVGWYSTWRNLERVAQMYLGLPPHRHIVFTVCASARALEDRADRGDRSERTQSRGGRCCGGPSKVSAHEPCNRDRVGPTFGLRA